MAAIQFLAGGTRLPFSIPSYLLLAVAGLMAPFLYRKSFIPPNAYCLGSALAFGTYLAFRAHTSPIEYLALPDQYLLWGVMLVYLFLALFMIAPQRRWMLVMGLLGLALINGFWGLLEYMRGSAVAMFGFLQPADYGWRASGLFICPNHLAGFLEVIILLGLSLLIWSRRSLWLKVFTGYAVLLAATAMVATGSRGGYLSLLAGLITFVILSLMALHRVHHLYFRKTLLASLAAGLVAAAALGLAFSQSLTLQSRTQSLLNSDQVRLHLWGAALQQFKFSPILGTGSGTYLYYGRHFRHPSVQADPVNAHNDYVELLAEYGLIGALLLAVFLATHLWSGAKAFRYFTVERGHKLGRLRGNSISLNIGTLSAITALLVHSFIDFNLHIPANALLAAALFGLLANPGAVLPYPEFHTTRRTAQARWIPLVPAVLLMATALPELPGAILAEKSRAALRDGLYEEAFRQAERGLAHSPRNPYLHLYLGQSLAELALEEVDASAAVDFWRFAQDAFGGGLAWFPQDKWLLTGMAEATEALGQPEEARHYLETAISADPNSASVRALYAALLHRMGRFEEAESQYRLSDNLFPNDAARWGLHQLNLDRAQASKTD